MTLDPLPGAIGISHLAVYGSQTPDGEHGGSPHMHFACTEAYVVLSGRGRVQTLGPEGFCEVPLEPLDVVWFTPGIIHRAVNDDDLQILVVMQNSGLPESGDSVLTFPPELLADPVAYTEAAELGAPGTVYTDREDAARDRRDLAVRGFAELRERVEREGPDALEDFRVAALALVAARLDEWDARWHDGALAAARRTGEILDALRAGDTAPLREARLHRTRANDDPRALGLCGRLATVDLTTVGGLA
jgi:hypothetical protein